MPSPFPSVSPTTSEQAEWHSEYSGAVLTEYAAILWSVLGIVTILFIRYYANRFRFRYHTYISIFIAYFCSFGIILLAPTDVALTIIGRKEVDDETIKTNYEKYNGKILM